MLRILRVIRRYVVVRRNLGGKLHKYQRPRDTPRDLDAVKYIYCRTDGPD